MRLSSTRGSDTAMVNAAPLTDARATSALLCAAARTADADRLSAIYRTTFGRTKEEEEEAEEGDKDDKWWKTSVANNVLWRGAPIIIVRSRAARVNTNVHLFSI